MIPKSILTADVTQLNTCDFDKDLVIREHTAITIVLVLWSYVESLSIFFL